jgi:NAD-specific glutamate dehydrogenase
VLGQGNVEVTTTEVTVVSSGLHVELTLAELNNGSGVVGVTNVNEDHAAGLLLGARQVELGDTVTKSGSGGVVDKTQSIEAGNISGINHGTALHIGEPSGNADRDIGDRQLELLGGDILDLGEVHGHQLGRRELLLLALVADLDTSQSIDVTKTGTVELLLDRDIGVVEGAADEALQRADGILQVRGLLCLGAFANVSAAGAESDQGPISKIFESAFRIPSPSTVGQHRIV